MVKKILVPLDGSPFAEEVLPQVAELALCCGSQVCLIHVIQPILLDTGSLNVPPYVEAPLVLDENVQRAQEENIRTNLEETAESLRAKGLTVECATVHGQPAEEIIRYARENAVDLIAMATHGRSGLGRLVFGSVATKVVREAGLPILLMRPKDHRTTQTVARSSLAVHL